MQQIEYIPLDEIKKPRDGEVVTDRWWVHHPKKGVVFIKMGDHHLIPVCNRRYNLVDRLRSKNYPDHDLVLVPVAYLGPARD